MFFGIKFSFFFSFSLRNDTISERHQPVGNEEQDQDHITSPIVSQQTVEPGAMIKEPVVSRAPVRPVFSRFTRYFRTESATQSEYKSETDDTHIADTHLAQSIDRESLEILLRSSAQNERPARATTSNRDTTNDLSDSSLSQHGPVKSLDTLPQGPFVIRQSPVLEDDSGSDLVSSLQRIRIGGLASYFEELERRALARTLASTTAHVSAEHDQRLKIEVEADQSVWAYNVADGEWSEVTVREGSGED